MGGVRRIGWVAILLVVLALLVFAVRLRAKNPRELLVSVRPVPGSGVSVVVDVDAQGGHEVRFRYGPTLARGLVTRAVLPASGKLTKTLIGLEPGATSHVLVEARDGDSVLATSGDRTVELPPLPDFVPQLEVRANEADATGNVAMSLRSKSLPDGMLAFVNRVGRVLWYRAPGNGSFSVDGLCDDRVIVHAGHEKVFDEISLDWTVRRRINDTTSLTGTDEHDFERLASGSVLVFGAETRVVDTRGTLDGGLEHSVRWDDTVAEVDPAGATVWRWSTFGHVRESEITSEPEDKFRPAEYELAHTNSIQTLPGGNLLLSFRNTSSVVEVDRGSGAIVRRIGGKQSDYRFSGDALGGFCRQHDARFIAPGRLLLFDNGNCHTPPESRAVEYVVDDGAKTVTLVWEYRQTPLVFATIAGSVERLSNGHTLISWGPRGIVTEVDSSGRKVWEISAPGFGVYRARRLPDCR